MKKCFLLLPLMLLLGCVVKQSNTGRGWVRNTWDHNGCFSVVFEREDGMVFTYDFKNQPAVWAGMHADIDYLYTESDYCAYTAGSVRRFQ
jgi:hypothetical protein